MILFYLSIPIMVLAVAIATVPLFAAMRMDARRRRVATTSSRSRVPWMDDEMPTAA